jgi:hypothetical protein
MPAHLSTAQHPQKNWKYILCIHTPLGQLAWHLTELEHELFKHLKVRPNDWDKHTTAEKRARIKELGARWPKLFQPGPEPLEPIAD